MKDAYLTEATIQPKIEAMLRTVRACVPARSVPFDPSRAALLVIDMQRYFLEHGAPAFLPAAPAIVPIIRRLVESFALAGRPVIFTRHIDGDLSDNALSRWWQSRITADNPYSHIIPELNHGAAPVLVKSEYDAFHRTPLFDMLTGAGVGQVVVCGVLTNLCCETTARSAFVRGFDVFFVADATATNNRELHLSTLLNLAHGFATLPLAEGLLIEMEARDEA